MSYTSSFVSINNQHLSIVMNDAGLGLDVDEDMDNLKLEMIAAQAAKASQMKNNRTVINHGYQSFPNGTNMRDDANNVNSIYGNSPTPATMPCVSGFAIHNNVNDMTMKMTDTGKRGLVRECVKKVLFRRIKFFRKELHGMYHQSPTTVCGLIINYCNMPLEEATMDWWSKTRKVVLASHTDHRNNVIKLMRLRFIGKQFCAMRN